MKKKLIALVLCLIIIFPVSAFAIEDSPAYMLPDGRISVDPDVFNQLTTNDQLLDVYKEETEYLIKTMKELKELNNQGNGIQEQRLLVLKDTISLKDQIIGYKDDNIKNYEYMFNKKDSEVKSLKVKSFIQNILLIGAVGFAISK